MLEPDGTTPRVEMLHEDSMARQPNSVIGMLDLKQLPGGALCGVTGPHVSSVTGLPEYKCFVPDDDNAKKGRPTVYQIDPFRARQRQAGTNSFVISGDNFPVGSAVRVRFGSAYAKVTDVSKTRIRGIIPTLPTTGVLDVVVELPDGTVLGQLDGKIHFRSLPDHPTV